MPNNRAAASPKKAPCRFEELMGWQLTEDERKVQRMRRYRRSGRTLPRWQWQGTSGGTPHAAKREQTFCPPYFSPGVPSAASDWGPSSSPSHNAANFLR